MIGFFGFNPVAIAIWVFGALIGYLVFSAPLAGFAVALGITIFLSFIIK
jgi:hypothetical protein